MNARDLFRRVAPLGATGIAVALAAATVVAWFGLDALARSRTELALLENHVQAGSRPLSPVLPAGLSFVAQDHRTAQAVMLGTIRAAAAERRLLLEQIAAAPQAQETDYELAADIIVSGSEADVLHLVRTLESGRPVIRFAFWRLSRTGPSETAIRLEARALGWWEPRR